MRQRSFALPHLYGRSLLMMDGHTVFVIISNSHFDHGIMNMRTIQMIPAHLGMSGSFVRSMPLQVVC